MRPPGDEHATAEGAWGFGGARLGGSRCAGGAGEGAEADVIGYLAIYFLVDLGTGAIAVFIIMCATIPVDYRRLPSFLRDR